VNTTKTVAGIMAGLLVATPLAHAQLAGPAASPVASNGAVAISPAAEKQILVRAGIILARAKKRAAVCGPGSPGFDQTCTPKSCVNDCGPTGQTGVTGPRPATKAQ